MKKLLLTVIVMVGLFLRVYRTSDFLGFWFDQGRDAKVVWDLIHNHHIFLIGPTTGIEGIFLGPFYYYLLAPFYFIGQGDPVIPAGALGILMTLSIIIMYRLARHFLSPQAGIIASLMYGLSTSIVYYHRWLSNPTPLPFFTLIALWLLLAIVSGRSRLWHWPTLGVVLGICLQCEAASASFFLPVVVGVIIIMRKSSALNSKKIICSLVGLGVTLLPQVYFDFRHDHLLLHSFQRFLITDSSFRLQFVNVLFPRLTSYFHYFFGKLYLDDLSQIISALMLLALAYTGKSYLRRNPAFVIITTWWVFPLCMLLFYHGNNGYVWDYYFTGAYPAFFLTVGTIISVGIASKIRAIKVAALSLVFLFLYQNVSDLYHFFSNQLPAYITLTPIRQAVDWVYMDANGQPFNVDVYVPPVISHSYDYVFAWRGSQVFQKQPSQQRVRLLYTLLEPDGEHPLLRSNWLGRQEQYASLDKELQFGPVTVQKRYRITSEMN